MRTIWTDISDTTAAFEIDGKVLKALIDIAVTDDDSEIDMHFESPEDEQKTMERFRNGSLVNVTIRVRAHWNGLEGFDYLGGCYIEPGSDSVEAAVKDHGMIDEALVALKAEIVLRLKQLKPLIGAT
jgi:hypothetical protein